MKPGIIPYIGPSTPPGPGFGDAQYADFQRKIEAKTGIKLVDYKPEQMRRRVSMMALRAGFESYTDYYAAMERDQAVLTAFLDKMTINVSELLRNPPRFDDLMQRILPKVLNDRQVSSLNIWSAGCSYGAEAYTLAMLMHQRDPHAGDKILGTDIDVEILRRARDPQFSAADMTNISPERRAAHFQQIGDKWTVQQHLRSRVSFARHDLLSDPYPRNEYDLILCRNVVIYFTDVAKERIYRGFYEALNPGGILFVGGTERLADHRAIGFELVIPFFYRKPLR
jgi:chemotaxis protein methyltransferase CheR